MFKRQRIFSQNNVASGINEWFVETREGVMGPYPSKAYAEQMLNEFKTRCLDVGSAGGRSETEKTLMQLTNDASNTVKMEAARRGEKT